MAWRRLITQVLRHQSEFGKAKHSLTRNNLSPNKFQHCTRNRFFFSQQRSRSSFLGNLTQRPRDLTEAKQSYYLKSFHRGFSNSEREELEHRFFRYLDSIGNLEWFLIRLGAYILYFGAVLACLPSTNKVEPILDTNTKFSDVEGVDEEAMAELEEIVDYIRDPEEYTHLGDKLPKCVLLCGPSDTDKTLLAKAIAGEARVPFFQSSGSKFDDKYVGADGSRVEVVDIGVRRVRDLFAAAKKQSPCIIFIDEIDAVSGSRNHKDQMLNRKTLDQMVVELDGFKQNEGIFVIGATDFPELLDEALVRPGRFDRHVVIDKYRRAVTNFQISYLKGSEGEYC